MEDLNGLFFNSYFIPDELIIHILSFVDPASLVFQCRRVCKYWKFIIDEHVWKEKIRFTSKDIFSQLSRSEKMALRLPWYVSYAIFSKDPFEKNLLKNNCGQEGFKYLEIKSFWLNRCKIEYKFENSDLFPHSEDFGGFKSPFVTSSSPWIRVQTVDLKKRGISDKIMDEFQPIITASEWYAAEEGNYGNYKLSVFLLDSIKKVKCEQHSDAIFILPSVRSEWNKVQFTFDNYGKGVRYIEFMGSPCISCKISGGEVKTSLSLSKFVGCSVVNS